MDLEEYLRQLNNSDLEDITLDSTPSNVHQFDDTQIRSNIASLDLNNQQFNIILARLKLNNSITRLNLGGCKLESQAIKEIAEVLATDGNQIQVLNLGRNNVNTQGLQCIAEALIANPNSKLHDLNLSGSHIDEHGAIHIANILKSNTLRTINLFGSFTEDGWLEYLIVALQSNSNSNLNNLILSYNRIIEKDIIILAKFLSTNPPLIKLALNNIGTITIRGLNALLGALQFNTNLEELDLSNNYIGFLENRDINYYSSFIKYNTQLTMINLDNNGLHPNEFKGIMEITSRNKHNKAINNKTLIDILKEHKKIK